MWSVASLDEQHCWKKNLWNLKRFLRTLKRKPKVFETVMGRIFRRNYHWFWKIKKKRKQILDGFPGGSVPADRLHRTIRGLLDNFFCKR